MKDKAVSTDSDTLVHNEVIKVYKSVVENAGFNPSEKLYIILDFWLELFRIGFRTGRYPSCSCLNIIDFWVYGSNRPTLNDSSFRTTTLCYVSRLVFLLCGLTGSSFAVEAGIDSWVHKFKLAITKALVKKLYPHPNEKMLAQFRREIRKHKKYGNYISALIDAFPEDLFRFCNGSNLSIPINLIGSPMAFFSGKTPYIALVLNFKNVNLVGVQHGGAYFECKRFLINSYESRMSDKYFSWGLSKPIQKCKRFQDSQNMIGICAQIYLSDSYKYPAEYEYIMGCKLIDILWDEFVFKNLGSGKIPLARILHPRNQNNNNSGVFLSGITERKRKNSIFIIHYPFQTIFYQCVYAKYPFFMILKPEWQCYYSEEYSRLLYFLRELGLLFYEDEILLMNRIISELSLDSNFWNERFQKISNRLENGEFLV